MLAGYGIAYQFNSSPPESVLVEVEGVASKVSESTFYKRGREINIIEFNVGDKRFSCANDKGDFQALVNAVKSGKTLKVAIDPNRPKAIFGAMTHYFRIRQGTNVLVSYAELAEQDSEGRFAVLFFAIGIAACMCVPVYQLTLGKHSHWNED